MNGSWFYLAVFAVGLFVGLMMIGFFFAGVIVGRFYSHADADEPKGFGGVRLPGTGK